jgi:hypothetical protein
MKKPKLKECHQCKKIPYLLIKSPKICRQGIAAITGTMELFDLCIPCFKKCINGFSVKSKYVISGG